MEDPLFASSLPTAHSARSLISWGPVQLQRRSYTCRLAFCRDPPFPRHAVPAQTSQLLLSARASPAPKTSTYPVGRGHTAGKSDTVRPARQASLTPYHDPTRLLDAELLVFSKLLASTCSFFDALTYTWRSATEPMLMLIANQEDCGGELGASLSFLLLTAGSPGRNVQRQSREQLHSLDQRTFDAAHACRE